MNKFFSYVCIILLLTGWLLSMPSIKDVSVKVSSIEGGQVDKYKPEYLIDGNMSTRWSSEFSDPQWIEFDFTEEVKLAGMIIFWEAAHAKEYEIYISKDGTNWKLVYKKSYCEGGEDDIAFDKIYAVRYLKFLGKTRATGWGYSIYEVIFKTEKEPFGPEREPPEVIIYKKLSGEGMIFIPSGWSGGTVSVWVSDVNRSCKFYFNGQFISEIKKGGSFPYILNLKNAKVNNWNQFKFISSDGGSDLEIKSVVFAKDTEAIMKEKLKLRRTSHEKYYQFLTSLYSDKYFPKWLNRKQEYWTIVGNTTNFDEILFSETGVIETHKFGFCLIPYLYDEDLVTYQDVDISIALEDGYLPLPEVKWKYNNIEFVQRPFWPENEDVCYVFYRLKNNSENEKSFKLILTIRPVQLNPKWQNAGYTKINNISVNGMSIIVNNEKYISFMRPADNYILCSSDECDIIELLIKKQLINKDSDVKDKYGLASAAVVYNVSLDSGEEKELIFCISNNYMDLSRPDDVHIKYTETKKFWEEVLNKVEFKIADNKIFDVFRTYLAYILISKDGPALEPGTRNYGLCWVRDAAVIMSAVLKTRNYDVAKAHVEFVSSAVYKSGEVPCIIEAKTGKLAEFAKTWKEYDGQGAYLFSVAEYYRFTKDKKFVKELFPILEKVYKFTEKLRKQTMTKFSLGSAEYGILPKSASHEGYLNNWQQSHWDNFWCLKGYKDLSELAIEIGRKKFAKEVKQRGVEYRNYLLNSIQLVQQQKSIQYIPASVGLADFDPTSTAISVYPTGEYVYLDRNSLLYTFNKYYDETVSPRFEQGLVSPYTPYEIRNINAFLLLGDKEKAIKMLYLFMKDMRPQEWHHWAEVVYPDYEAPSYIGDMPHCWVGAEFLNVVRNLFVYEEDDQLILCAGIDEDWIKDEVYVKNFPTYYGDINYIIRKTNDEIVINFTGTAKPKNGFVVKLPVDKEKIKSVLINNKNLGIVNECKFKKLPTEVKIKI